MNRSDLERARATAPITNLSLEGLVQRRDRKERRRRLSALVVAAAIVAFTVGGAYAVLDGNGRTVRAGDGDTQPNVWTMPAGLTVPPGSYAYMHSVVYGDVEAYDLQTWFSPTDGSGRVREAGTTSDQPLDSQTPGQQIPYVHDRDYSVGEMTSGHDPNMDPLVDLSTDPALLVGQLVDRSRADGASPAPAPTPAGLASSTKQLAQVAGGLLARPNATPELKAALSQVLAGLDGVTVSDATSDPTGRPAWSVALDTQVAATTWWFDPQSDQPLAKRVTSGQFTFITVYEASGVVSGTHNTDVSTSFIPSTTEAP
jgi:hypothetical protein